MNPEDKRCGSCPHTRDQHDKDGFCEVEDGILGFCKCQGFADKAVEVADEDIE